MTSETNSIPQFIFAPPNFDAAKRKGVARACEPCRRRKKRCTHDRGTSSAPRQFHGTSAQVNASAPWTPPETLPQSYARQDFSCISDWGVGDESSPGDTAEVSQGVGPTVTQGSTLLEPTPSSFHELRADANHEMSTRFIGHLNPEGAFIATTSPTSRGRHCDSRHVGVWHTEEELSASSSNRQPNLTSSMSLLHSSSVLAQKVVLPVMEDQGLGTLPAKEHLRALERFFFDSIYPLLPLVDENDHVEQPEDHPARVLRSQGMCLLASMNQSMASHLYLPDSSEPQSHTAFGCKVFASMRINIEIALVTDRLTLVRAWAMMSLFSGGPSSLEQSSQAFARAVQLTFTIGLHLDRNTPDKESRGRLYSCIWVLDRLHAAIHGRPVAMHTVDMARSPMDCVGKRHPAFEVVVSITMLLDEVIGLYRPGSSTFELADDHFSGFESIVSECSATKLPSQILST